MKTEYTEKVASCKGIVWNIKSMQKHTVPTDQRKTDILDAKAIVLKKSEVKEEKVYALVNRFVCINLVDEATFERNKENIPSDYRFVCDVMHTTKLYIFTGGDKCHQIKLLPVPIGQHNDKGFPLEQVSALTMA